VKAHFSRKLLPDQKSLKKFLQSFKLSKSFSYFQVSPSGTLCIPLP
jgi:hypothetical protein